MRSILRMMLLVIAAVMLDVNGAEALDIGGALRGAANQIINNAVRERRAAPPPQQQQYQQSQPRPQQQMQTYTYEEYTAAQNGSAGNAEQEEDSGDAIEVIATGIGKDSDDALLNALRAAIEQAVGTLVDSETLAKNDEVVNDQILSYSAGFVEAHKIIGEPKTQDGMVTIKIQAWVKKTELTQKLEAASIHTADFDGQSLFGEAITKVDQYQSASEILKKAFEGFPQNIMEVKGPDKNNKPRYDERNGKLILPVEVSVNHEKYDAFIKKLLPVLRKISTGNKNAAFSGRYINGNDYSVFHKGLFIEAIEHYHRDRWMYLVCTGINDAMTQSSWEIYVVPKEALTAFKIFIPHIVVDIIDKNGEVVASMKQNMPYPAYRYANREPVAGGKIRSEGRMIFPMLSESVDYANRADGGISVYPGTREQILNFEFDVSINELKRMDSVECRFDE